MIKNDKIKIDNISFGFTNSTFLFKDFSLIVPENEIVTIIGKSGCGKSTLLNIISGLLKTEKGSISLTEKKLVYLTQLPTLISYRTALENCLLGIELRKGLNSEKINEVKTLLKEFGLAETSYNKFPKELSGGMKQRIGLIQSIAIDSSLYLLDEPFTAIDSRTIQNIENVIWEKLKNQKCTAIIVNHDLEQALLLSDKIIIIPSSIEGNSIKITLDSDFCSLSPIQRVKSQKFSPYLLQIIKAFSES